MAHQTVDARSPAADAPELARARRESLRAGQWLRLLLFRVHPGAPILGPGMTHYAHLLDPAADDADRRASCAALLPHVRRQADDERWRAEGERARRQAGDPFDREWPTTQRGAALEAIAELMEAALADFDRRD